MEIPNKDKQAMSCKQKQDVHHIRAAPSHNKIIHDS